MDLLENYLQLLNTDNRSQAKEWRGHNIPYGDDSKRPNLVRECMTLEGNKMKINCLRKLRDQVAMNPIYQTKIDRWVDAITDTFEPTPKEGTVSGSEFKTPVQESYIQETKTIRYKGKTFKTDEEGFLLLSDDYSKEWIEYTSKQIDIKKLTPKHYKVINFVRNYYVKNNSFPMLRVLMRITKVDLKTLYVLFPKGPIYSLGRLTGFPFKVIEKLNK